MEEEWGQQMPQGDVNHQWQAASSPSATLGIGRLPFVRL